jgi:lysozyme family protein
MSKGPLRYLIGADGPFECKDGETIVVPYGAIVKPSNIGEWVQYCNLRDELNSGTYGPYLPSDDIDDQYNEPAPDPAGKGFWDNLRQQLDRAKSQGFTSVELDNCDTYTASVTLLAYNDAAERGLTVWAKNPAIVSGNREAILAHSAVVGVIVEKDCGSPSTYDAMRKAVGKPDLPIRFVAYGNGRQWAQQTAGTIQAGAYSNMGVTYSSEGEYASSEDVLLPTNPTGVLMAEPAWLAEARASIGKYFDSDAPKLAREVAAKYPDMAAYAAQATGSTPWCGIFFAAMMTRAGIRPPYDKDNVDTDDFMWADAPIEAKWGTIVSRAEAKPGDVVVLRTPHHITFFDGNNYPDRFYGIGGNQGDAVTRASFSWDGVRAVVRPPTANAAPIPMSNRFKTCLPRVLKHEGGNVQHPDDPGGRTSRGITAERWREWRATHPGLPEDVWQAPQSEVEAIYLEKYWQPLWCDMLPPGVDYAVFDFGVNSGPSRAAKYLQEIVGSEVDGEVGPNTVAATKEADPEEVINALCDNRMYFLKGLSTWGTFGNGWTNRVNDVRRDALADADAAPIPEPEPAPVPKPDKPKTMDEAIARLDAVVADIKELARVAAQPAPQLDWAKIIQPILAEIAPKIVPLLMPYVAQMLPQLLPYLLDAMFGRRQSVMSKPAVQMGASGIGGGLLALLADHFLNK